MSSVPGAPTGNDLYLLVVLDREFGTVEAYGPLDAPAAVRALEGLRALLTACDMHTVTVTTARLHLPGHPGHPDDP